MEMLRTMADKLWDGVTNTADPKHHPFVSLDRIEEVASGVAFYKGFSNITVVEVEGGCVLVDTGSFHPVSHGRSFDTIRGWTKDRVLTAIYTHGHVDHAYGLPPFLAEAQEKGWSGPAIVGHEGVRDRMDRYVETSGYNSIINERQFGHALDWPVDPIYPTQSYTNALRLEVGGVAFELRHARGETDDHTWVYLPGKGVLCTGDLFIWAAPNAGNPQKVQRYVIEWCRALREMAKLDAKILLPGHGLPVYGEARVGRALRDTADYLESIYLQTLDLLNAGADIDEMIHAVKPPDELAEKPYLRPIYDEPEFIVRSVHRCLGGWYCGVPSELKPASRSSQAREIAGLCGGVHALVRRAEELREAGDYRLACHLIDWAIEAESASGEAHNLRARIYRERAEEEPSTMSKGIFGAAARDSTSRALRGS